MEMIELCTRRLREEGSDQWDGIYPNLAVVEEDARSGSLFVGRENGICVGAVALNDIQPEQYKPIPWHFTTGRALVIHRLCVHPEWQGRGIARLLMDFTEQFAQDNGFASIRLDAYTGNPRAIGLYERRGYASRGQTFFPRRKLPFECMEKIL